MKVSKAQAVSDYMHLESHDQDAHKFQDNNGLVKIFFGSILFVKVKIHLFFLIQHAVRAHT
jgi:hypothetical protein